MLSSIIARRGRRPPEIPLLMPRLGLNTIRKLRQNLSSPYHRKSCSCRCGGWQMVSRSGRVAKGASPKSRLYRGIEFSRLFWKLESAGGQPGRGRQLYGDLREFCSIRCSLVPEKHILKSDSCTESSAGAPRSWCQFRGIFGCYFA